MEELLLNKLHKIIYISVYSSWWWKGERSFHKLCFQLGERWCSRPTIGDNSKDFQLQQEPIAADLAHGYGVHEEKGTGK